MQLQESGDSNREEWQELEKSEWDFHFHDVGDGNPDDWAPYGRRKGWWKCGDKAKVRFWLSKNPAFLSMNLM